MALSDKLKFWTGKAKDAAADHQEQIQKAVKKAEELADRKTHGKYRDQIHKAGDKIEAQLDGLKGEGDEPGSTPTPADEPTSAPTDADDPPAPPPQP